MFLYCMFIISSHLKSIKCNFFSIGNLSANIKDNNSLCCLFDVYYSNYSRAFLTLMLMQLVPLTAFMFMLLGQQFLFISIGLTQYQLFKISRQNVRFSLVTYLIKNFKLKVMFKNWLLFIFKRRSQNEMMNFNEKKSFENHLIWGIDKYV